MYNKINPIPKRHGRRRKKVKKIKSKYFFFIILIISIIILFIFYFIFRKNIFFSSKQSNLFFNKNKTKKYIYLNKTEIIDDYLSSVPLKFQKAIDNERKVLEKYLNLTDLSIEKNEQKIFKIKEKLLNKFLSLLNKKNFTEIKYIFFTDINQFGNRIIILNNLIYYCEILGFKNIYLNSDLNWYIKDKIISDNISINMIPSRNIHCNSPSIACFKSQIDPVFFFFYPDYIKPQIRLNLIKYEIKKNLPQVEINPNDLYIHIRSGDIFRKGHHPEYAQPPLCFYKNIINNFNFTNITIIAENKNNPVIGKMLEQFPNIIYKPNSLSIDMAYLSNSYNLVASISSLLLVLVKFNDNLKKYFEYDIYRNSEKYLHFHHDYYSFPINFTIYRMKPSKKYKNEMFTFDNQENQYKLMIEEKCINKLKIIEPNV